MKKILFLSAAVAMASTSAAHANDFSGFRIEVQTGLDVASAKGSYLYQESLDGEIDADETYRETERTNATGFLYGIGAGYDAEISPNIVAGIEGSINFSNAEFKDFNFSNGSWTHIHEGEDEDEEIYDDVNYIDIERAKAKREIEIGARLGYKVNPSTLIYVKGGYVNGRFKLSGEKFVDPAFDYEGELESSRYSYSKNLDGYRVGAGIETLLGSNAFAKMEYRYTNFKNFSAKYSYSDNFDFDGDYLETETSNVGLSRHQVALGLGIRF